MILLDVNVLVYAHRVDAADHERYLSFMAGVMGAPAPFGVSQLVLSGFLRVVTHPRVFRTPTPLRTALGFATVLRTQPNCVIQSPGARHWEIFVDLCKQTGATGNVIPDAYHAALAIETGSEWVTTDLAFARFSNLRVHHPLD